MWDNVFWLGTTEMSRDEGRKKLEEVPASNGWKETYESNNSEVLISKELVIWIKFNCKGSIDISHLKMDAVIRGLKIRRLPIIQIARPAAGIDVELHALRIYPTLPSTQNPWTDRWVGVRIQRYPLVRCIGSARRTTFEWAADRERFRRCGVCLTSGTVRWDQDQCDTSQGLLHSVFCWDNETNQLSLGLFRNSFRSLLLIAEFSRTSRWYTSSYLHHSILLGYSSYSLVGCVHQTQSFSSVAVETGNILFDKLHPRLGFFYRSPSLHRTGGSVGGC